MKFTYCGYIEWKILTLQSLGRHRRGGCRPVDTNNSSSKKNCNIYFRKAALRSWGRGGPVPIPPTRSCRSCFAGTATRAGGARGRLAFLLLSPPQVLAPAFEAGSPPTKSQFRLSNDGAPPKKQLHASYYYLRHDPCSHLFNY